MPYKQQKKRAQYMRKYRNYKQTQMVNVKKALEEGEIELAKKILEKKPSISVLAKQQKLKKHGEKKIKKLK
jgi:hypothetical protein